MLRDQLGVGAEAAAGEQHPARGDVDRAPLLPHRDADHVAGGIGPISADDDVVEPVAVEIAADKSRTAKTLT